MTAATGLVSLGATSGPASAGTCSGAGVTVVVDFKALGGGVQSTCDANGGGEDAASLFGSNGFALTYVQRQPGFVCRINGSPSSDPCVNTPPSDAYWGLFWSDGTSGSWSYASEGVGSLTIPDGGSVAFAWQGSDSRSLPGASPPVRAASATPSASTAPTVRPSQTHVSSASPSASTGHHRPTPAPTATKPTRPTPSAAPGSASSSISISVSPSASAPDSASTSPTGSLTPTPSASAATAAATPSATSSSPPVVSSDPTNPTSSSTSSSDLSVPPLLVVLVIALLFVAGTAVAVVRRRSAPRA